MLKGIQKNVIMIQPRSGGIFERAYFILRDDKRPSRCDRSEMVKEANRIIADSVILTHKKRKKRPSRFIMFILGALFGGGAVGILWFLLPYLPFVS